MPSTADTASGRSTLAIVLIIVGVLAISINDVLIKSLSGEYPLHQMVGIRASIGLVFSFTFLHFEGGLAQLKTSRPFMHMLRGLLVVISNLSYFAALAVLPLSEATALFFAMPLMLTLLSIPLLGEKVGPWRLSAVIVGFIGVVIMQRPWQGSETQMPRLVLLLPVLSALTYALMQILTRKLGVKSKASALAIYIQGMFLFTAVVFAILAGDGKFAHVVDNDSWRFVFRAWVWPAREDIWLFVALGLSSGVIGYCLSAAYRMGNAATVAPFEYLGLPLAMLWGWSLFAEVPSITVWVGAGLILAAGLFVFLRERIRNKPPRTSRVPRRF